MSSTGRPYPDDFVEETVLGDFHKLQNELIYALKSLKPLQGPSLFNFSQSIHPMPHRILPKGTDGLQCQTPLVAWVFLPSGVSTEETALGVHWAIVLRVDVDIQDRQFLVSTPLDLHGFAVCVIDRSIEKLNEN
jgi:hypothetical protein